MIASKTIAEIQRLLAERTHSHRKIATLMGVSRGTVGSIALGRRRENPIQKKCDEEPVGPPQRCPTCGALVLMPCLLCRLLAINPHAAVRCTTVGYIEKPRLDLRPEHRARYEEVRQWRRKAERMERENAKPQTVVGSLAPRL
jgi:hypothetical protein